MTGPPVWLLAEEKLPHVSPLQLEPLEDHLTPALSFVVGVTDNLCVLARPARFGDSETEMLEEDVMVSVRLTDLLCAGRLESVTVNVSAVALAASVGMPVITPVAASNDRPTGRVAFARDHLWGNVPPVAARVAV